MILGIKDLSGLEILRGSAVSFSGETLVSRMSLGVDGFVSLKISFTLCSFLRCVPIIRLCSEIQEFKRLPQSNINYSLSKCTIKEKAV